ncbi:MAG: hypothetical protein V1888_00840 [archaeon]
MIIQWVAIAVLIFLGFTYLKLEHHGNKIRIAAILIVGSIIYFSIIGHFGSGEIDITSPRGIINSIYLYFGWIGNTASSLWDIGVDTTHMVGNAIKINNTKQEDSRR